MPFKDNELHLTNCELHLAIGLRDTKSVMRHLNDGADIDNTAVGSWPPLSSACTAHAAEIVELLLMRGADIEKKHGDGETPLFFASRDPACTKLLLEHKANPNVFLSKINPLTPFEPLTPLNSACYYEEAGIESMKLMLEHKADPTMKNKDGKTAYTFFESIAPSRFTSEYTQKIRDLFDKAIAEQSKNAVYL